MNYIMQSKHHTALKSLQGCQFGFFGVGLFGFFNTLFGKYNKVILFQCTICFSVLATPVTKEQYCHMSPILPLY